MIVEIQIEEAILPAPLKQEPVLILQDVELVHVGGGLGSCIHF